MSKYKGHTGPSYTHTQNFLTCGATIRRMLRLTDLCAADHVLEIGPGKGHITQALLARCGRVTAVEIDPAMYRKLAVRFSGVSHLHLICRDFMDFALAAQAPYKVFSNLPFAGTSAILRRLTAGPSLPVACWLIMEKGVAKRFLGLPHETVHSLAIKPYFEGRIVYHLRREDFHPMPSVDAVLVHLRRKDAFDLPLNKQSAFAQFVREMTPCLQGQRRGPMNRMQAEATLHRAGLADVPPSATMRYVQWLCLFRWWARLPPTPTRP